MKVCLIGGTGGMGKAMLSFFARYSIDAYAIGRKTPDYQTKVESADIIMLLVPLEAISTTMEKISSYDISDKLIVNTCSAMLPVQEIFERYSYKTAHMHLLFGPEFHHFTNQNIAITKGITSVSELMDAFRLEQVNIVETTPEEHDIYMMAIQCFSHMHTIMLAHSVASLDLDKDKLEKLSTYSFRLNAKAIKQIMKQPVELWRSIQFKNSLLPDHIESIKEYHDSLFSAIKTKDSTNFDFMFNLAQKYWQGSNVLPASLGVLGPKGTYSEQAALLYDSSAELIYYKSIPEVISAIVSEKVSRAIIPHENSIHGTVIPSIEGIYRNNLFVSEEVVVDIDHCLAGMPDVDLSKVTDIYSHPQALGQCSTYLQKMFPQAKLHETNSTAESLTFVATEKNTSILAIGSELGAKQLDLKIYDTRIQDEKNNKTSFFVVSKEPVIASFADRTLLALKPNIDSSGLLHDMLGVFKSLDINLSKLESRPSKSHLGSYIFFVIVQTVDSKQLAEISDKLSMMDVDVVNLGSYGMK